MSRKLGVAVDWDGTCVENAWPDMGAWLPGAVDALRALSEHYRVQIHSCRLSPVHPSGVRRHEADVVSQWHKIRRRLDEAGLGMVEIARASEGKPFAVAYVDDRALRFNARRAERSWAGITDRLLLAAGVDREAVPSE